MLPISSDVLIVSIIESVSKKVAAGRFGDTLTINDAVGGYFATEYNTDESMKLKIMNQLMITHYDEVAYRMEQTIKTGVELDTLTFGVVISGLVLGDVLVYISSDFVMFEPKKKEDIVKEMEEWVYRKRTVMEENMERVRKDKGNNE
jgi:hypothetical protein